MKEFFYKNRVRVLRGNNSKLSDLPEEKQNILKNIKKNIEEYYNKKVDVYFHGSYKHGYWDEFSDFDLMLPLELQDSRLKDFLEKSLEVKVDLIFVTDFKKGIII